MKTFKPLKLKWEDELAVILGKLENLLKNQEEECQREKGLGVSFYYFVKGNLLLILKHQLEFKLKKFEDLSIPDLERLIGILSSFKIEDNSLKEKFNRLLDKKFQKICGPCLLVKIEYADLRWFDPYRLPCCDTEALYHYIIAKKRLNKLEKLKSDRKLAFILRKTYDLGKLNWFKEKYLRPTQNKWVHFIAAIGNLEILNAKEKEAVLKHNAELKINKNLPILAQLWNRTWLFAGLGIKNIEELRSVFPKKREFLEAKKNICGFLPKTLNFEKEDIFAEGTNLMQSKYISIKNFCNYAG